MRLEEFDYDLPEGLIAQEPLVDRSASRLLHLNKTGEIHHLRFTDCLSLLEPGDLLVFNDTKVTAKRLEGHKISGGAVSALLLKDLGGGRYEALMKPGRRLQQGASVVFDPDLHAEVVGVVGERRIVQFADGSAVAEKLEDAQYVALPPYVLTRITDASRYQTVYANAPGSAAAPTAGLHFTPGLIEQITAKGVRTTAVTLSVGIDTFRPVQAETLAGHQMHGEMCSVTEQAAEAVSECRGRIVAVGTTTVRTLETHAVSRRVIKQGETLSKLFVSPGFDFQIVDGMFTNFHLPRTTMLMMVSALAGQQNIMHAYREAVAEKYRFLSFGDSMLIL